MEKNPRSFYRIRFGDCDPLGHLNNARYIDYFINAREDHLRQHYDIDLKDYHAKGESWVVGSHEIIYKRPAFYNEMVCISSSVISLSADSILVEMIMTDEESKYIKSILWSSFIHVNVKTGKKENHTEDFMEFARQVEVTDVEIKAGLREREAFLRAARNVDKV
jgi:acyl-CoA thioester hydrolase